MTHFKAEGEQVLKQAEKRLLLARAEVAQKVGYLACLGQGTLLKFNGIVLGAVGYSPGGSTWVGFTTRVPL